MRDLRIAARSRPTETAKFRWNVRLTLAATETSSVETDLGSPILCRFSGRATFCLRASSRTVSVPPAGSGGVPFCLDRGLKARAQVSLSGPDQRNAGVPHCPSSDTFASLKGELDRRTEETRSLALDWGFSSVMAESWDAICGRRRGSQNAPKLAGPFTNGTQLASCVVEMNRREGAISASFGRNSLRLVQIARDL